MKKRMGESGNIFFTLFGAVALVGVVGAATSTLMRGPVGTVVALNQRAKADSQMQIAMKLAMLEAQNNSNDCDHDTFIEPVGAGAAIPGLTGGGRLPQVGSTTNDPWGSPYGYCGWNHGTDVTSTCSGGTTPLLRGHAAGQGTVIAVLSAGPDRIFGSTCVDNPAPNAPHITRGVNGADDLIVSMTYAEANEASGGLWSISSTDPDAITTNRSLDVSTGAQFSSGDVGFTNTRATFGTGSTLDFTGGGLFMLPNECQSASCGNPNKGLMRRFTNGTCPAEGTQEVLQICDGTDWLDIGGAGAIVAAAGNPGEIQYNAAGVMGASSSLIFNSSNGLTVGGDSIFSADLRVNQILRATTLNVSGNSILTGTLDVDGSADFDSTIDVALGATFGSWLRGSDGTSGAPTYSFSSDTDSGMFFSSSALRFSVDGTERMALSAGGLTMVAGHSLGNFTVDGTLTTNDLNVNNNITANRFISRMATTSAALPAFETEPGTGMYSAVDNTLSLVAGGTPRIVIDGTGDVGIGVLSPDAKLDVGGEIKVGTSNLGCGPTLHGAIRYVSGDLLQVCSSVTGVWEDIGTSGGGGGGAASYWTRISSVDRRLYYDDAFVGVGTNNPLDDFHVAGDLLVTGGYSGTASIGASGAGSRMFFDPESGSFRAGVVSGAQWDSGNVGNHTFAFGENAQASGDYARAMGANVTASGIGSMVIGNNAVASNLGSVAMGVNVASTGINSVIWGLGAATGAHPIVSGTESHATIMGDQSGVNMTANQTWALLGGRMLIDQTPAVNPAVSGTLSLDVEGGVGAMQYCDENGVNCFTAASVATGGVTAPGNNRELIYNSGGVLGANPNMTFSSAGNLTLGGTGAITLPSGDGTNRPVASADGMLRYNTALGRFEGYQGGQWRDLITGTALAAGANTQIQFNSGGYFGAVPAFTFNQGEMRVDGTDFNRPGVVRIRGNETVPANYLDATMILESTRGAGSIWSQTLVSNIPSRNGDMVFAHFNGSTWAEPLILADNGRVGIFSTTPRASLDINTTDAILLPVGGVGNRPAVPVDGMLRYNSQSGRFEGRQGGLWQDILTSAVAGGAASPNRGIQFNSNGAFGASNDFQFTSGGSFLVRGVVTYVGDPSLPSGGGSRMFFDPTKAAFRAGAIGGAQWDNGNVGNHSVGMGSDVSASGPSAIAIGVNAIASNYASMALGTNSQSTADYAVVIGDQSTASGPYSMALGHNIVASGTHSMGIGLDNFATNPVVSGTGSLGIFMGAQTMAQQLSATKTMGLFGGKLVIDPREPAQQMTARGVIDVGGATDAVVLPIGTVANRPAGVDGMIRYNSQNGKFEGFQQGAWQDILTSGVAGGAAAPERGIQFNSGGSFAADTRFLYTSVGDFIVGSSQKGDTGAFADDNRLFFDKAKGAFRAGVASGDEWDNANVGNYSAAIGQNMRATGFYSLALGGRYGRATGSDSVALGSYLVSSGIGTLATGYGTNASGDYSTAMGKQASVSGSGSMAIGLATVNPVITTNPVVSGPRSMGIFMGAHEAVNFNAANTMGIFGGSVLIDPRVPALQMTPRATFDMGAATDAMLIPRGVTGDRPAGVDGMIRYNSQTNRFEGHQAGAWQDLVTIGTAPGAASPSRGIQFNSGGNFAATANFQYSPIGSLLLSGTHTGVSDATMPAGAGTRMFFDASKSAFRAGNVTAAQWDAANVGEYSTATGADVRASGHSAVAMGNGTVSSGYTSVAMGSGTTASNTASVALGNATTASGMGSLAAGASSIASGAYSMALGVSTTASGDNSFAGGSYTIASGAGSIAMGRSAIAGNIAAGSGYGDGSFAIGLVDDAISIVTPPRIHGGQSMGIFMGDQSGRIMTSSNTMGLFGGQLVIDPRVPAQQLSARGVIDVGAATDAIVLPSGSTAQQPVGVNGMLRYNSQTGKFEGFQGGSWQDIITGGGGVVAINDLTDATTSYSSGSMFLGQGAGANIGSDTDSNVALGMNGLNQLSQGNWNTAIGNQALRSLGGAGLRFSNTALGAGAAENMSIGNNNVTLGAFAMHAMTNAEGNVAIGTSAMNWSGGGTGDYNVAIGTEAMNFLNGGASNVAIGRRAADNLTSGSNNIIIGTEIDVANPTGDNQLNIGNLITGTMNTGLMQINGTGALTLPIGQTGNRPAGVNGMIRYNSQSGKFEGFQSGSWQDIVTGAATSTFLSLSDTPSSYAGQANKFVRVNAGNTALEFTDQIVPSVSGQPAPTGTILDDLGDVTIALPTAGQILTYSSGQWVNAAAPVSGGIPAGANTQLQFNSNGAFGAVSNLTWNVGTTALGVTGRINVSDRINIAGQSGNAPVGASLSGLSDVTIAGASAGQILTYSGGKWINAAAAGGSASAAGVSTNIQFNSGGNMGADSTFVYSAAGNLGVGTSSPAAKITAHSANAVNNTVLEGLRLVRENTAGNGANNIGNSMGFFTESNNGTMVETARIDSVLYDAANNSKDASLRFYTLGANAASGTTTPTESMRIDSRGTLYAGRMTNAQMTTAQAWNWPTLGLAMWGRDINLTGEGTAASDMYLEYYGNDGAWAPEIIFYRNRNTQATPYWPNANDSLGRLSFTTNGVSNGKAGGIEMKAAATHNTGTTPGTMEFYTTPTGSTVTLERMSIKDNGRIQIGTGTPAARLDVNGAIQIGNDGETCASAADHGSIRFQGGVFQFCRDYAEGWSDEVIAPVAPACDSTTSFSSAGTHAYTVPAGGFGTLTIRLWGAGGGGGSANPTTTGNLPGSNGGNTTINSRSLFAGGGVGGNPGANGGTIGTGGAGGVATGGDTNINGASGAPGVSGGVSGKGGDAPGVGGGVGGAAVAANAWTQGNPGTAPGGGGSGGEGGVWGANAKGGGGGSGAYVEVVLTPSEIAAGTVISDIVVGLAGAGSNGSMSGGNGGGGRAMFICSTIPGGIDPGTLLDDLGDVTITAPSNGQTLFYSGGQWVNGAGGGGGAINDLSDAATNYTSTNMFMGRSSGEDITTGAGNTSVGTDALADVTAGDGNTAMGSNAMNRITTGYGNTAIGSSAMVYHTGSWENTAVGGGAMGGGTGSSFNTALGSLALADSGGGANTALGARAGLALVTGMHNVFVGQRAGDDITDGNYNIIIGSDVDASAPTVNYELNIGNLITGTINAGLMQINGTGALTLPKGTTAQQPAVPVNGMLRYNSQTDKFEGYQAGSWMNIIGGAGSAAGTNTQLQFNSNGSFGAVSNLTWTQGTTTLGVNGKVNLVPTAASAPVFANGTTPPAGANTQIQFNNSGAFGASGNLTWNGTTFAVVGDVTYTGTITDVSDMRLKNNILPLNDRGSMLNKLDQIGTYSFTMKDDQNGRVEFGVMAQEINKVFPELVKVDENTAEKYMSVNYVGLIAPLIEASKELKSENESLKAQISTIEERMASLEGDMNGMKAHTGYGISKAQMGLGMMLGMMLMGGMAGVAMIVVNRRRRQE